MVNGLEAVKAWGGGVWRDLTAGFGVGFGVALGFDFFFFFSFAFFGCVVWVCLCVYAHHCQKIFLGFTTVWRSKRD